MAQIKVLDLNDSNSLFELSYEDAQKVSGGAIYGTIGFLGGYGGSRIGGLSRLRSFGVGLYGGAVGAAGGLVGGPLGASLSN